MIYIFSKLHLQYLIKILVDTGQTKSGDQPFHITKQLTQRPQTLIQLPHPVWLLDLYLAFWVPDVLQYNVKAQSMSYP